MNGQTQVQIGDASGWLRINRAYLLLRLGSGGTAAGTLYIAASGVSSVVFQRALSYASIVQMRQPNARWQCIHRPCCPFTLYVRRLDTFTAAICYQANNYANS